VGGSSRRRAETGAAQVALEDHAILMVDAMQREDCFGRVDGNSFILGHGRLRIWMVDNTQIWHAIAVGPSTPTRRG